MGIGPRPRRRMVPFDGADPTHAMMNAHLRCAFAQVHAGARECESACACACSHSYAHMHHCDCRMHPPSPFTSRSPSPRSPSSLLSLPPNPDRLLLLLLLTLPLQLSPTVAVAVAAINIISSAVSYSIIEIGIPAIEIHSNETWQHLAPFSTGIFRTVHRLLNSSEYQLATFGTVYEFKD